MEYACVRTHEHTHKEAGGTESKAQAMRSDRSGLKSQFLDLFDPQFSYQ